MERWARLLSFGLVVAAGAAMGAACASDGAGPETSDSSEEESHDPGIDDPGLVHVHGLDVDPVTADLYAATHTGLFRVADGKAERVGDRYQDTMGFTIDDRGRFLGSGHPDLRDLRSGKFQPLLGLVESKDKGETWEVIALSGKADFHALDAAHGLLYGYNASTGAFMVSTDGRDWETRSMVRIADFAVDPQNPDALLAATGSGMAASADGGRTWSAQASPDLLLLAWPPGAEPIGVTPGGDVLQRRDSPWERVGSVGGAPEALYGDTSRLLAAVDGGRIVSSADQGRTWQVVYQQ